MRTSLNNIKLADDYLHGQLPTGDALLFEAQVLIDSELREDVMFQQSALGLVQKYSRKKLKAEIETVQQKLFTQPAHSSFARRILNIFR
ncbi:MAG: hypothetical protein EOP46_02480 [Sphingobacteriaceae bacterium]|nr:MAG: hypothetical protein EOP46_02480 [Sphingobacteriaceae bacterium]